MPLRIRKSSLAGLALVLCGFLAACQSTQPLATPSAPGISVGITGGICPNAVISSGQQVTWTNQDSREHIVRHNPAEGTREFDSGTLLPGDSFSFTFVNAGSYNYECSEDGSMTGTITVGP